MTDLLREAPLGQLIRLITRNKVLQYPEERADFVLPAEYSARTETNQLHSALTRAKSQTVAIPSQNNVLNSNPSSPFKKVTKPIAPQKIAAGTILVDWYTTDDAANPQNWSNTRRGFPTPQSVSIHLPSTAAPIYTSSETAVTETFGVNPTQASLPLSLAHECPPLRPAQRNPVIGRNPAYIATLALFVILSVPAALVDNFGGLVVLRYLQGFFGSPCFADGGVTM